MKECSTCKIEKAEGDFYVRNPLKGTLHRQCKDCIRGMARKYQNQNKASKTEYQKRYYKETRGKTARQKEWGPRWEGIKEWLRALKGENPCSDCHQTYHYAAMDLDHVGPDKGFNIASVMGRAISDEVLLEEIQKCELVCSNCHRIRTWKRNNP